MTKSQHNQHRQNVINFVYSIVKRQNSYKLPSYRKVVTHLNTKEILTVRGNAWTEKRLFRFLQNAGVSGIWGLSKLKKTPAINTNKP